MNPFADTARFAELQGDLEKHPRRERGITEATLRGHLRAAALLGYPVEPPARILDVGCGIGDSVEVLCEWGYDAYGVDILEYWGRDLSTFWQNRPAPTGAHLQRLHVVDLSSYRFPFPDGYFDFAFSDEVFEHVFNHETVFREIVRVLNTRAISLHQFPGANYLMEGHINVPLPMLCYNRAWLASWALLGRRSARQTHLGWRKTLDANIEAMKYCSYCTKKELRMHAAKCSAKIDFVERTGLLAREYGRIAKVLSRMPRSMKKIAAFLLSFVSQRYMMIRGG